MNKGKNEGRGLPRYSPYLAIADLVDPFVEDGLVIPLAAVHEVLPARKPFVVERVDLIISSSPNQRVVAVIAVQGVVALAAVEAVSCSSRSSAIPRLYFSWRTSEHTPFTLFGEKGQSDS